jgi:uncharacterized protein YwgA
MSILFSDSKGHALIAFIVKCHEENAAEKSYLGRTHIQKIPYILKAIGIDVPFNYQLYLYGPFSQGVAFAIDDLLADDILLDSSQKRSKYSNFVPGEACQELIDHYKGFLSEHKKEIINVVEIFSSLPPEKLELFTTLHYVYLELKETGVEFGRHDIIREFIKVKKDKFKMHDIEKWLQILIDIDLIKV